MTAPAAPRIPTPGDLARRQGPRPPTTAPAPAMVAESKLAATEPERPRLSAAEEAIKPARLGTREHFRKYFLFGMRTSQMHPHARLVGHDLMWRASHATGRINAGVQPRTEQLALATGLTTAQVDVALQVLHTRGWLQYRCLQEGPRAGQTVYSLAIPTAALEGIRTWIAEHPREFRH